MLAALRGVTTALTRFRSRSANESHVSTVGLPGLPERRVSRRVYKDLAFRVEMVVMSGMMTRAMRGDWAGLHPPLLAEVLADIEKMRKVSPRAARTLQDRLYNTYAVDAEATYQRLAEMARQARIRLSHDGVTLE